MKVSTTSWHYRLICKVTRHNKYDPPAANLCPYMRTLLWAFVKTLVIAATVLLISTGILLCLGSVPVGLWQWYQLGHLPEWATSTKYIWNVAWTIGCIAWFLGITIGILRLLLHVADTYLYDLIDKWQSRKKGEPGLLASWYKDWHKKTCTPIEFEDPTP